MDEGTDDAVLLEWERSRYRRFLDLVFEFGERGLRISSAGLKSRRGKGREVFQQILEQLDEELPMPVSRSRDPRKEARWPWTTQT